MELALDDHAVEHVAAIVDRGVGDDVHVAGVGIDLDLGDVDAVGEGQRRFGRGLGVEILRDRAALLQLGGARGKLEQRDAAVGADDAEASGFVGDVGFRRLQQHRRDALALLDASHRRI